MTKKTLFNQADRLDRQRLVTFVNTIQSIWFVERDGRVDFDKQLGSDEMAAVTVELVAIGCVPKVPKHGRDPAPVGS